LSNFGEIGGFLGAKPSPKKKDAEKEKSESDESNEEAKVKLEEALKQPANISLDSDKSSSALQGQPIVPVKRGRGRPRKNPVVAAQSTQPLVKRGRGRPRKNPAPKLENDVESENIEESGEDTSIPQNSIASSLPSKDKSVKRKPAEVGVSKQMAVSDEIRNIQNQSNDGIVGFVESQTASSNEGKFTCKVCSKKYDPSTSFEACGNGTIAEQQWKENICSYGCWEKRRVSDLQQDG
jgi:hypothetical protein